MFRLRNFASYLVSEREHSTRLLLCFSCHPIPVTAAVVLVERVRRSTESELGTKAKFGVHKGRRAVAHSRDTRFHTERTVEAFQNEPRHVPAFSARLALHIGSPTPYNRVTAYMHNN